jgi:peptidoglycan/xylan/chitin deacetylase (PgdA/CDA1 family)
MTVLSIVIIVLLLPMAVGSTMWLLRGRHPCGAAPAGLLFHAITPRHYSHFSYTSPEKFNAVVQALARRQTPTATVREAAGQSPLRSLVLTFDDGFLNFYTHAFPVLETFGAKVTVFPTAGFIGLASDWDILPRREHLGKSHIREIADHGHEIGSHTMTHADLTKLRTGDLERELRDSKRVLEDITGKPVTSLSFPFGFWNKRVWETARRFGYTQATVCRFNGPLEAGLIPVLGVYSFDTLEDVFDKAFPRRGPSHSIARCNIMSHFAKGTPLWKFRAGYTLFP